MKKFIKELSWSNFYRHPRFWRHTIAWAIFLIFVTLSFVSSVINNPENSLHGEAIDILPFLFLLLFLIYSSFYTYNKLFKKKKRLLMFGIIILLIIIISLIDSYFETSAIQIGDIRGFWANIVILPFILFVAFGFKLAYHGGKQLFLIERLEAKQTESELKLLKSQVNPHFLFNTLNNIYSTNLEDHEKANEIILELADLLRYQLESNKKQMVPLQSEIDSLENYISLEKIRVLDCDVNIKQKGNFKQVEIIPLLLLPFVENAFKYGTGIQQGDITLNFNLDEFGLFSFYCKNKIVQKRGKVHSGGIGLENVKKRLAIMYHNKYELFTGEKDGYYIVELKMNLQ